MILRVTGADAEALEALRAALGERSCAAAARRLRGG